jgi:hypothetical protein
VSGLAGAQWGPTPAGVATALLPLLLFLLVTGLVAISRPGSLRHSLIMATVICGLWAVVGCELLSLGSAIAFWPILAWWLVPLLVLAVLLGRRRSKIYELHLRTHLPPWGAWTPLVLASILLLLAAAVAFLSPPNTHDALTYHLPRQVRWMQQGSVEHFPIRQAQQVALPPMAEFVGLHLMVLSRSDFYATLVQWFALLMAATTASAIAGQLGGRALAQAMAALLVVSNPMAWLQASSAKNDVVAALWVLIVAYGFLQVLQARRCGGGCALLIGGAAGLALLTKPTGMLFALPLLAILGLWLLMQQRIRCIPAGVLIAVMVLLVNAGHLARNVHMFDSPSPGSALPGLSNETLTVKTVASNLVRNAGLHLGTPTQRVNQHVYSGIEWFHRVIGQDLDDERTTAYARFAIVHAQRIEDKTPAPVHLLLLVVAAIVLPVRALRRGVGRQDARPPRLPGEAWRQATILAVVAGAGVLFCLILKWQPWHARLHIGILALAAPVTAAILCCGRGLGAIVVCAALMVPLVPTMTWNDSRPLLGPRNIWTTPREEMLDRSLGRHAGIEEAVEFIRAAQPRAVGIVLHVDGEYPMMRRLLRTESPPIFTDPLVPPGPRLRRP